MKCKCGCGKECNNFYVIGHNLRYKTPWNKGKKGLQKAWNKGLKGLRWQNVSAMISHNKKKGVWNKGKKRPEISGENHPNYGNKMSNYQKDKLFSGHKRYVEEKGSWNKGKKFGKISRKRMSESQKKYLKNNPEGLKRLKEMRKNVILPVKDTSIEIKIQSFLKQLGIEFFTHQYMKEIEHGYQCDILIPSLNLVIECDGNYWHKYPVGLERDHIRTKELIEKGFKVLRLWESEIRVIDISKFRNLLKQKV